MNRFLRGAKRVCVSAGPYLLLAAIFFCVIFFPPDPVEAEPPKRVVRVWSVDTFEGGKGSRTAFLRRVANSVAREGLYFLVTNYTAEGAREAVKKGEAPDLISYGVGLGEVLEYSLPLPYSFAGGEAGGKTYAVPWCRGQYYLFSLDGKFEGRAAVSAGGCNLASVAAAYAGVKGEETEPLAAYTGFLGGKYGLLLGTQRDVCRFAARGQEVFTRPIEAYNDLYEVISVCSREKFEDCLAFIEALRGTKAQEALGEIGMLPLSGDASERTLSVFTDASALAELRKTAVSENAVKNLDKFLKTV